MRNMSLKSISGLVFYVADLRKTAEFYEALGFRIGSQDDKLVKIYLNWFWMEFVPIDKESKAEFQSEANAATKGAGLFVGVNVDNVDEMYQLVCDKGFKPSSEPRDWPWGRREFVLRDPDGYKLVFFQKK